MKISRKKIISIIACAVILISCDEQKDSPEVENKTEEKTVPVETMIVKPQAISQSITLTGTLQPVNTVALISEVTGRVINVYKYIGDDVDTSEVLAVIDDVIPESRYEQARSEVLSAENNLQIAEANFESDKILYKNDDISELAFKSSKLAVKSAEAGHLSAVAAYKVAEKAYNDTRIKSPVKGTIARKYINEGTMVSVGTALYEVVNINKLKIELSVAQEYINRIEKNMNIEITVPALNNKVFEGKVKRISPQADLNTGGYLVEAELDNNSRNIKGGMTAKVEITLANLEDVIVIPDYALLTKNKSSYVYRINGDSAVLTEVKVGQRSDGFITINNGLSIGDQIVTVGFKNLGIDTRVQIENSL